MNVSNDLNTSSEPVVSHGAFERDFNQINKGIIQSGSKSFYFASVLLPQECRTACYQLYSWCRYVDDQVDLVDVRQARLNLIELKGLTEIALKGDQKVTPPFQQLREVARKYQIPSLYFEDMLKGLTMDVEGVTFRDLAELRLYCYRVAGTVGLMMSHVLGVSDKRALDHARELGIAMQLTNIARDVRSDFERGRVYLPMQWLRDLEIEVRELMEPYNRNSLVKVIRRLLDEADQSYRFGREGIPYLSKGARLAITVASQVYRRIGVIVGARLGRAWDHRVYVPWWQKCFILFSSFGRQVIGR